MKIALSAALLSLFSIPSFAAGSFQLPVIKPMRFAAVLGQRPGTTVVPLAKTRDTFRTGPKIVELGGLKFHMAIQTMRDGQWAVSLVPQGKNHHNIYWSSSWRALKIGKAADPIGSAVYRTTLVGDAVVFTPIGIRAGGPTVRVSVSELKIAAWEKAVPLPSLGPNWRLIFQSDLWIGAGMRTFAFLESGEHGLHFHNVRSESVDSSEERVKQVGGRKIALRIVAGGLTVKAVSE